MFRTVPLSVISRFSLDTQQWYMSYRFADSLLTDVSKPLWHIPLLCVQWKTPDDGQRNCPKHVEFYSKNKFEKLVHVVGLIISIYHDARWPERQIWYQIYIRSNILLAMCQFRTADCRALCNFSVQYFIQLSVRLTSDVNCFKAEYEVLVSNLCRWSISVCWWHWEQRPLQNYEPASQSQHTRHSSLWIPRKFLHWKPLNCRVKTSFFCSCTL